MHILDANEIFGTTFYTFDRIMELGGKNGPDAYALYTKLVKQSRIQQTNQTKSLNAFLREGLGWGDERLKKARDVLKQLGLIDDIIARDKFGKINGHYVRVNFLINENKVRNTCITYDLPTEVLNQDVVSPTSGLNQDLANPTSGQTDTNALSTQYINAGSTQNNSIKIELGSEATKEFGNSYINKFYNNLEVIYNNLNIELKQDRKAAAHWINTKTGEITKTKQEFMDRYGYKDVYSMIEALVVGANSLKYGYNWVGDIDKLRDNKERILNSQKNNNIPGTKEHFEWYKSNIVGKKTYDDRGVEKKYSDASYSTYLEKECGFDRTKAQETRDSFF